MFIADIGFFALLLATSAYDKLWYKNLGNVNNGETWNMNISYLKTLVTPTLVCIITVIREY